MRKKEVAVGIDNALDGRDDERLLADIGRLPGWTLDSDIKDMTLTKAGLMPGTWPFRPASGGGLLL